MKLVKNRDVFHFSVLDSSLGACGADLFSDGVGCLLVISREEHHVKAHLTQSVDGQVSL